MTFFFEMFCRHTLMPIFLPPHSLLFCFWIHTVARQVQQEQAQMEAQYQGSSKAPDSKALPQWTMEWMANAYTCSQIKETYNRIHIKKHGTCTKYTHVEQQLIF